MWNYYPTRKYAAMMMDQIVLSSIIVATIIIEKVKVIESISLHSFAENGETSLPSGIHRFPFSVLLRQNLPSSFEGSNGSVRYTVEAVIDKPWKFDHTVRVAFTVICILDLNREPFTLRVLFFIKMHKSICKFFVLKLL